MIGGSQERSTKCTDYDIEMDRDAREDAENVHEE